MHKSRATPAYTAGQKLGPVTPNLRPTKLLLRQPKEDSAARIFCFPYSGLGASMYNRWPRFIDDVEICLIQPSGRENRIREDHYGTYEQLAAEVANTLMPYFDRPFGFFGHCGGALPAFATAVYLEATGLATPDYLFMSSQVAPHEGPYGRFLAMSNSELALELVKLSRALGGEPNPDMLEMSLRVLRADITANQLYKLPEPVQLSCALLSIGWREDAEIPPHMMGGWNAYVASKKYRAVVLEGGHHEFLNAPAALLDEFAASLRSPRPLLDIESNIGIGFS